MPAYFAFNVVLSLHIFLNEGVDIAIMEVGIGGLTDSTNFIRNPIACAITSLGLEHTDDLGDTIESIAWQKSGIFKVCTFSSCEVFFHLLVFVVSCHDGVSLYCIANLHLLLTFMFCVEIFAYRH